MNLNLIHISLIGVFSFLLTFLISPLSRYLGKRLKIFDFPNNRKIHQEIVLRTGGITIFCSFILTFIICLLFFDFKISESFHLEFLIKIIICSFLFFLLGLFDDLISIKPFFRFLIEIILSSLIWSFGFQIQLSNIIPNIFGYFPFLDISFISLFITVVWITGLTNAINWIDGMDGILCIFTTIVCIGFAIISYFFNNIIECLSLVSIAGCSFGFLFQNTGKNKMFMGDSGSHFLGFYLATFGVISTINRFEIEDNLYFSNFNFWVPFIMLILPIFDMTRVIIMRIINSKSPFHSDKRHFHHFLLARKYDWQEIFLIFIGATQFSVVLSLTFAEIINILFIFISFLLFISFFYISKSRKIFRLKL